MLDRFIKVRQFGVGRRLFSIGKLKEAASKLNNTALVDFANEALAHDQTVTQPLNVRWRAQKSGAEPGPQVSNEGREADQAFDTCLGGIDRVLLGLPRIWGTNQEPTRKARKLRAQFFPAGVGEITSLSWVDEVAEGRRIVRDARSQTFAADVQSAGLTDAIMRLEELTDALDDAIKRDPVGVLFSEVRGARAKGQAYLRALIAKCIGDYPHMTEDDEAARLSLLAAVVEQDDKIAFYNRRRRPVPDIDPTTGDEVEPDEAPEAT